MRESKEGKILFVAYLGSEGHLGFNNIWIRELKKYYSNIDYVLKEGMAQNMNLANSSAIVEIPRKYYKAGNNSLFSRINLYLILKFIKKKVEFDSYDKIIFAEYEEISLWLGRINYEKILVNHNNIKSLSSKIKSFFLRELSKKNINVVFEDYIKDYLLYKGVQNVIVKPHGIPTVIEGNYNCINSILPKVSLENYEMIIFAPSSSSTDINLINKLYKDSDFNDYLKKNRVLLVLKGKYNIINTENIYVIDKYLTSVQYSSLFKKSDVILLAYPSSFKFRVSGIFYECIANNKLCILSDISSFKSYNENIIYNPFFKYVNSLIDKIDELKRMDNGERSLPYYKVDNLNPTFDDW